MPLDAIRANQSNLNIALYVRAKGSGWGSAAATSTKPLSGSIAEWEGSSKELRQSMNRLLKQLQRGVDDGIT